MTCFLDLVEKMICIIFSSRDEKGMIYDGAIITGKLAPSKIG